MSYSIAAPNLFDLLNEGHAGGMTLSVAGAAVFDGQGGSVAIVSLVEDGSADGLNPLAAAGDAATDGADPILLSVGEDGFENAFVSPCQDGDFNIGSICEDGSNTGISVSPCEDGDRSQAY